MPEPITFAVWASDNDPEDIVGLREAAGKNLGANLDPTHFFWQGIDPVESARFLGENECIFHVHAKDCAIDKRAAGRCGGQDRNLARA